MIKIEITENFTEKVVKVMTLNEFERMLNSDFSDNILDNRERYIFRFIVE